MRSDRPSFQRDVIAEFSTLAAEAGLGYGYYYSTGNNYFLNRDTFKKIGTPLPGQVDVSDEEFDNLVFEQTAELWTKFG
jgi:alpha-L-fucosidase